MGSLPPDTYPITQRFFNHLLTELSVLNNCDPLLPSVIPHAALGAQDKLKALWRQTDPMMSHLATIALRKVMRIQLCDNNGKDTEDDVRGQLGSYIRGSFPKASLTIQQRLVDSMVLRHKWVLYRRLHYGCNTN